MKMFRINKKTVWDIVDLLKDNGEFDTDWDVHFRIIIKDITENFQINFGNDDTKMMINLQLPRKYVFNTKMEYQFYKNIILLHNFNIMKFSLENNISFVNAQTLFSICHELGHLKHYIEEINEYGKFKTYEEECNNNLLEKIDEIEDWKDMHLEYRKLPTEMMADKYAKEFMNKYKYELLEIIQEGLCEKYKIIQEDLCEEYEYELLEIILEGLC